MAVSRQKNEHGEEQSFGRLLKSLRTQNGTDLKTISDETRIAVNMLRLIEDEAYDKLPDAVFVKGFLRSYAKVVGAQPDRIVQSYLAGRHFYYEALRYEANLSKTGRSFWPRMVLSVGLLAGIIFISVSVLKKQAIHETSVANTSQSESTAATDADLLSKADTRDPADTEETKVGFRLQISAVEATWLKIIIDHQSPRQYTLEPEDRLDLKAASGFNLLIGNATGIRLKLNGRPVAIEGKHGQVVTLKLP